MFSSLNMVILAVDSFNLLIENLLCSNEKKSQSFDMMYGKTRVEWGISLMLLPYMKMFFLLEWPCKSQYRTTSLSFSKVRISFLTAKMTG